FSCVACEVISAVVDCVCVCVCVCVLKCCKPVEQEDKPVTSSVIDFVPYCLLPTNKHTHRTHTRTHTHTHTHTHRTHTYTQACPQTKICTHSHLCCVVCILYMLYSTDSVT